MAGKDIDKLPPFPGGNGGLMPGRINMSDTDRVDLAATVLEILGAEDDEPRNPALKQLRDRAIAILNSAL